jgi:SAM-dependent methyltransferase
VDKLWLIFNDLLSQTIFHPQYFLKIYEHQAINVAKKYAKGTLIDLGCGRQLYKKELLPYVKKYIGVDHPKASLKYKEKEQPDILADAADVPLPSDSCDLVMMVSVLEHLPDPLKAIQESYRLLNNKGHLIIITVQFYPIHDAPYDYFRYTPYALKELLKTSKFKIVTLNSLGNFPILYSQLFNIYLLYSLKNLIKSHLIKRLIGFLFLPVFLILSFISNCLGWILSQILPQKNDAFAIYNLVVATKTS